MSAVISPWSAESLQTACNNQATIPAVLLPLRQTALAKFNRLPTQHDEAWKYTTLSSLHSAVLACCSPKSVVNNLNLSCAKLDAYRIVFIDGYFSAVHSSLAELPVGVVCCSLWQANLAEASTAQFNYDLDDPFAHLAQACFSDGLYFSIAKDTRLKKPVHWVNLHTSAAANTMQHGRHILQLAEGAAVTVFEETISLEPALTALHLHNQLTTVHLQPHSELTHYKLQNCAQNTVAIAQYDIKQQHDSRYQHFTLALGSDVARETHTVQQIGDRAISELSGIYQAQHKQTLDFQTHVQHAANLGRSKQYYKGVVRDKAHGVFQGAVHVAAGTVQNEAHQTNRNLVLSATAEVDAKPALEIYAEDVICSHGCTVGYLDEAALFYLRARGIEHAEAIRLLVAAFTQEVLSKLPSSEIVTYLQSRLTA